MDNNIVLVPGMIDTTAEEMFTESDIPTNSNTESINFNVFINIGILLVITSMLISMPLQMYVLKTNKLKDKLIKVENDLKNLEIITKNQYYIITNIIDTTNVDMNIKMNELIVDIESIKMNPNLNNEYVNKCEFNRIIFDLNDKMKIIENDIESNRIESNRLDERMVEEVDAIKVKVQPLLIERALRVPASMHCRTG